MKAQPQASHISIETAALVPRTWFSGLRNRWGFIHANCADPECRRQFRPLLAPLPSRTGIYLDGRWYCGSQCLMKALARHLARPKVPRHSRRLPDHRIPLGLLMMSRGEITYDQLKEALEAQRLATHGRLGEWLCELGYANERQITVALGVQSACPVLSRAPASCRPWSGWLPLELQIYFKAIPIHFASGSSTLSLAFGEHVDHTLLYTAGRMLRCQTRGCLMPRSEFEASL